MEHKFGTIECENSSDQKGYAIFVVLITHIYAYTQDMYANM